MKGRTHDDRGQMTLLLAITVAGILVLIAAVYDGGEVLAAKRRTASEAQSAARAGAQAIDAGTYRQTGDLRLDPTAASLAAREFLESTGYEGTVDADQQAVRVTIRLSHPTTLLGAIGIDHVSIEESAESKPLRGVAAVEP